MPEIVQEIGAYAGLASVLGVAVLAALFFSQARDVRRLREWAGRAPERAEQQQPPVPGRVAAPSQAKAPAVPGQAAAAGAGARPAAVTAAAARPTAPVPAGASAPPPVPAGASAPPVPAGVGAQAGTQAPPRPSVPVPAAAATTAPVKPDGPAPGQNAGGPATPAGQRPGPPVPSGAPRIPSPAGAPARPASEATAIIAPASTPPWYRRLLASPRYLVLAVAGVLILGGGAAFGITQLTSDDSADPPPASEPVASDDDQQAGEDDGQDEGDSKPKKGGAVRPADVTVAVLNGTTVPGLAASLGDKAEEFGFQVGTVADFSPNQQLAESVVHYAAGHEREAAAVGRKLNIGQREPASAESQGLAGEATVIVITGADKAP